ncbi:MAG: hypothetical protein ACHQM6_07545, partial [Candidatus Kapaibacterium sp.]
MRTLICIVLCLVTVRGANAQSEERKTDVLEAIAMRDYRPTFSVVAARLTLGIRTNDALRQLDTLLFREYGDMFWMYGCTGLYFSAKKMLPPAYKKKIRDCWK